MRCALVSTAVLLLACGGRSSLQELEPMALDAGPAPIERNACGGTGPLPALPGAPCGACGRLACDGDDALRCEADAELNACGECGALPDEVCNGYDDDCDGSVDEGCVLRLGELSTIDRRVRLASRGDRAVFDATGLAGSRDVVLVSLDSPSETAVLTPHALPLGSSDDPSREVQGSVDGSLAAWTRGDPRGVVVVYDLERGEVLAESDTTILSSAPVVEGGRVVFTRGADRGEADLWLYTEEDGFTQLTAFEGRETAPDLAYPFVVYERAPPDQPIFHRHIEALNLETGERIALSAGLDEGWHVAPAIDGTNVVWQHSVGSSAPSRTANVVLYDLASGERRYLTSHDGSYEPRVSGSLVCWTRGVTREVEGGYLWAEVVEVMDLTSGEVQAVASDARGCDLAGRSLAYLARFGTRPAPYYRILD